MFRSSHHPGCLLFLDFSAKAGIPSPAILSFFPAWYGQDGNTHINSDPAEIIPKGVTAEKHEAENLGVR